MANVKMDLGDIPSLQRAGTAASGLRIAMQNISGQARVHNGNVYLTRRSTTFETKLRTEILHWLSPLSFHEQHDEIRQNTPIQDDSTESLSGDSTGKWLLEDDIFDSWRSRRLSKLWYHGMPGAGKTVLASVIINHMQKLAKELSPNLNNGRITYLYLSYKYPQPLSHLVGSIVRQLVQDEEVIPPVVTESYSTHQKRGNLGASVEELSRLLSELSNQQPVYIVIDALDECKTDRKKLLKHLMPITSKENSISILITSRLLDEFTDLSKGFRRVSIEASERDIAIFVDHEFKHNDRLRRYTKKDRYRDLRADVKSIVIKRSNGMFLLASLHMKSLGQQLNLANLRHALEKLPDGIDGTYDLALERIKEQPDEQRKLAWDVLAWIVLCQRQLTISELLHALACIPGTSDFDPERIYDPNDIQDFCGGLVVVSQDAATLVHYTTQTYFRERAADLFSGYHSVIAQTCASYLSLKALEQHEDVYKQISLADDLREDPPNLDTIELHRQYNHPHRFQNCPKKGLTHGMKLRKFPFVEYAACYLGHHLREDHPVQLQKLMIELVSRLLETRSKRLFMCRMLYNLDLLKSNTTALIRPVETDHEDSRSGYLDTPDVQDKQDTEDEYEYRDAYSKGDMSEDGRQNRNDEIEDAESEEDCTSNTDLEGISPGGMEKENGDEQISDHIETSDDESSNDTIDGNESAEQLLWLVLATLCINTNGDAIEVDDPESPSVQSTNPEETLIRDCQDRRMSSSSEPGSINSDDWYWYNSDECFEVPSSPTVTPLHLAVFLGWIPLVEYLGNRSSDIDSVDQYGHTPLSLAMQEGHVDVIGALLTLGASVDLTSADGHALIFYLAQNNRRDTIRSIVPAAQIPLAEPRQADFLKNVATFVGCIFYIWIRIQALLSYFRNNVSGAIISEKTFEPESLLITGQRRKDPPLAYLQLLTAAQSGDLVTIERLVSENKIDLRTQSSLFHSTALFLAVAFEHCAIVSYLIDNGVDVDTKGLHDCTALHLAASQNMIEMVKLLLEKKADIMAVNSDRRTAWSANINTGRMELMELLVQAGTDLNVLDRSGCSTLYSAAAGGHLEVVDFLLSHGANPSIQTRYGWAPLHWAANNGKLDCVRALIKAGANLSPMSDTSRTPLDMAIGNQQLSIEQVLREAGAKTAKEKVSETHGWNDDDDDDDDDEDDDENQEEDEGELVSLLVGLLENLDQFESTSDISAVAKQKVRDFLLQDLNTICQEFNNRGITLNKHPSGECRNRWQEVTRSFLTAEESDKKPNGIGEEVPPVNEILPSNESSDIKGEDVKLDPMCFGMLESDRTGEWGMVTGLRQEE